MNAAGAVPPFALEQPPWRLGSFAPSHRHVLAAVLLGAAWSIP